MSNFGAVLRKLIIVIVIFTPQFLFADPIILNSGEVKLLIEKTNIIDHKGNFPCLGPDNSQENNISMKNDRSFYGEFGISEEISAGVSVSRQRVFSLYNTNINHANPSAGAKYVYDKQGNIQLNQDLIATIQGIRPYSFSFYKNEFFLKNKLLDRADILVTYHFGYISFTEDKYDENAINGGGRIEFFISAIAKNKIMIRRYFKSRKNQEADYLDLNVEVGFNDASRLATTRLKMGFGKWLDRKKLMEIYFGYDKGKIFQTYPRSYSQETIFAQLSLYSKIGNMAMSKVSIKKKFSDSRNVTEVISSLIFRL